MMLLVDLKTAESLITELEALHRSSEARAVRNLLECRSELLNARQCAWELIDDIESQCTHSEDSDATCNWIIDRIQHVRRSLAATQPKG